MSDIYADNFVEPFEEEISSPTVYQIEDGKLWSIPEAKYIEEASESDVVVELMHNGVLADEEYLRKTLGFYGMTVGHELMTLDEVKAEKLAEINEACDTTLAVVTASYPDTEVLTFDQQKSEAEAYQVDSSASCPLLEALAAARGLTMDDLVERVIAKASAFAVASGSVIGQRQALEDRLDECTTVEEVEAITVELTL